MNDKHTNLEQGVGDVAALAGVSPELLFCRLSSLSISNLCFADDTYLLGLFDILLLLVLVDIIDLECISRILRIYFKVKNRGRGHC